MPRKAHKKTKDIARQVGLLAGFGFTEEKIALVVDMARETLRKYYSTELQVGRIQAHAQVANALFTRAIGNDAKYDQVLDANGNPTGETVQIRPARQGCVQAQRFYLERQAGWIEEKAVALSNPDGSMAIPANQTILFVADDGSLEIERAEDEGKK